MITAIDPQAVRMQSQDKSRSELSLVGANFATTMYAAGATAGTAVAIDKGYQPAAVTQAAITGLAGAPGLVGANPSNAPYYGVSTAASPIAGGGYAYGGSTPFAGGYTGVSAGTTTGATGAYGGFSSQDNYEKSVLFQQMNDANWEMLVAQVTVNELSRDYQARSNILKTKTDTELNAVRNMRA